MAILVRLTILLTERDDDRLRAGASAAYLMIGSGKTTIGVKLANKLGWPFFDLDQEMNRSIGGIFHDLVREQGWLAFREIEYGICKCFSKMDQSVIYHGRRNPSI